MTSTHVLKTGNSHYNLCFRTVVGFLTLLCLLASCTRGDDQFYISELQGKDQPNKINIIENLQMPTLEVSESDIRKGNLSDMMEITDVIYLDNTAPIGKVNKLLFYHDYLCIFDREITNTLQLYDRNGRYLRSIGQQGEGPGEYVKINDVQINPYTDLIELWDGHSQKILSFDETGLLHNERKVDIYAFAFGIIDTSTYLFYKGNSILEPGLDYKLIAVNADNQDVKGKLFQVRENESQFTVQDPDILLNYNAANGQNYFYRLFDDHIYTFKDNQMTTAYRIDFKNKSLNYDRINFNQEKNKIIRDYIFNPDYFSMVSNAIETDQHLFFTFGKGTNIVYAFYHKQNENSHYFLDFRNDLTGSAIPKPLNADSQGNIYFADEPGMYIESIRMAAEYQNVSEAQILEKWKTESPKGHEIYNHVSEFDNPIILVGRYIFE